ncbi:MAG TPA: hypothetical protein VEY69_05770 [Lautropia sp.]|nr:hypothetical protein [Lautropia sp.]
MIDLMAGRATLAILTAMSLTACAAVGSVPVNQEVSLRATEGGERVEAACEVSNDKATWTVVAPAVFSVTRSEKPLTVECRTPAGGKGYQVFEAARESELPGGGNAGHGYPRILELVLGQESRQPVQIGRTAASVDDLYLLPEIGDEGRKGYRRFLAGDSPRAFAVSPQGRWVRVNAVRGAARLALDRCQSYGGRCRLYAVDDQVVWDQARPNGVIALY